MSLAESARVSKKRRIQHACDACRKRKIKCENGGKPGEACAHCYTIKSSCTYGDTSKGGAPSKTYVERLEDRLEKMEKVLRQLCTDDTALRELQEALGKDNTSNELSNTFSSAAQFHDTTPNALSMPTSTTRSILTNPLEDIAMLIRSKATESPSVIMDTVAANIRRVGQYGPPAHSRLRGHLPVNKSNYRDTAEESDESDTQEDFNTEHIVAHSLKSMYVQPPEYRFFGKSSGTTLISIAMEAKLQAHLQTRNRDCNPILVKGRCAQPTMKHLRSEFWTPRPWESSILPRSQSPVFPISSFSLSPSSPSPTPGSPSSYSALHLPPADLAPSLIENYFTYINLHFPLLHRPTFNRMVEEGGFLPNDHEGRTWREGSTESGFARVYLLVCALGAWYSDDPRCLLDAELDPEQEAYADEGERRNILGSAGWKWFNQVQLMRNRSLFTPPTLEDLQVYALSAQFLQASSAPQSSWTMAGIGIRLAQDVGIHRRNSVMSQVPTRDGELWNRAFWVLVCLDRVISCHLGRSCAIQDEDFDLDMPIECDDEFWDVDNPDPTMRFKQPPAKPSLITHFLLYIELTHILNFSMRTVYAINKSTSLCGFIGPTWEQTVISELDSALNKWADSVPSYLRWDPHCENNDLLFNQSASLWATYYLIQILVHRPFIPSRKKTSSTTIPSLAICTNAARACCHLVDAQQRRTGAVIPQVQMAVFQSAVVLLLSIWSGKRSGLPIDSHRGMKDVHKCMDTLKMAEQRWHAMGKVWDILYELASVGDLPLPLPQSEANMRYKPSSEPRGGQDEIESIMFAYPDFSEFSRPSSVSNAARPPTNGVDYETSRPWPGVNGADPTFDFTQIIQPPHSGGAFTSDVSSNGFASVPYQGSQPGEAQQVRYASSFQGYPYTANIPAHSTENGLDSSDSTDSSTFTGYQYLDTGLSDADLIDIWMNAPSGLQLDEWGAYFSSVSTLAQ